MHDTYQIQLLVELFGRSLLLRFPKMPGGQPSMTSPLGKSWQPGLVGQSLEIVCHSKRAYPQLNSL